jgi:hypothetical protein
MTFISPLWLLALIPWAGVAIWLLVGRNPRVAVPFIALWQEEDAARRRAEFRIQRPPIAIACMLLSILLGLIAAAKPSIIRGRVPVQILIDHGVTMSGRTPADRPWAATLTEVRTIFKSSEVEGDAPANGLRDREALIARVQELKGERDVVVVSNQELESVEFDSRIVRVPTEALANVGIVRIAARETPRASVMVRLRNSSDLTHARLKVRAEAESSTEREIELPARDEERDYFVDLDRLGNVVSIEVVVDDEVRADNRAWLVRVPSSPRIEMRSTVSPELARMVEVYGRHRSTSDASPAIAVVDASARLAPPEAGVIVSNGTEPADPRTAVRVADHPITSHVRDWQRIANDALMSSPPSEGWTPVVQAGTRVLVAVREQPARQVWVEFSSSSFARSPDFVVFWTDVFDWLGGSSGSGFRTEPVTQLDSSWQRDASLSGEPVTADPAPGVYCGPNGALRSMSAMDLKLAPVSASADWREKLAALSKHPRIGASTDLSRPLLIVALALIAVAALCWNPQRGAKSPTISPTITVDRNRAVAAKGLA